VNLTIAMTNNVLQHRHFDLRQTINFAVKPINNDDLDSERLRWRRRDDCWHYAAQFHVFLILQRAAKLFALEPSAPRFPIDAIAITKTPSGRAQYPTRMSFAYMRFMQRLTLLVNREGAI
jgi:hypothetical protein